MGSGKINHDFSHYFIGYTSTKFYENQFTLVRVIINMSSQHVVFKTQCIHK